MKVISIFILFGLLTLLNAGWIEDQNPNSVTTEEVITPDSSEVQSDDVVEESSGWTDSLGSEDISQKATQNYFIGLINGNSYGNYSIDVIYRRGPVDRLYRGNGYNLFWFKNGYDINTRVKSLIKAIEEAPSEALDDLTRYHYDEINALVTQVKNGSYDGSEKKLLFTNLDILLSDAFFNLAHDLHNGILDYDHLQAKIKAKKEQTEINYKWNTPKSEPNYLSLIQNSFAKNSIKKDLYDLVNHNLIYERLKEAYNKYKDIRDMGGWPKIPAGKILRYGSKGKRVNLLAKRLSISGDLTNYHEGYNRFDKTLKLALKKYQKRMGLWVSGTMTPETRRSLNISAEAKLKLIKLNIEKSRWETSLMDGRFILVNIPDFMLRIFDNEQVILASRVVCGRRDKPTPIFSSTMSYLVLNPTWTVPNSIVVNEMLPKLKENPYYLDSDKFAIYDGWGKNRKEIDPGTVDWSKYDKNSKIPYAFVRKPGIKNPLGIMKFMFPNNNAVYIHDTPSKRFFKKRVRAYSHGCIRLHNPENLLKLVANEQMSIGYKKIKRLLKKGELKSIGFDRKLPVLIRYYTVFVNDDGTIKFSYDIYGYDKILLKDII